MTVTIDAGLCVGCGLCTEMCPDVFKMEGDKAVVLREPTTPRAEADCRDAKEQCPVFAITVAE